MSRRLLISIALISILLGVSAGGYVAYSMGIPSIAEIKQYKPTGGTKIYADDDVMIGELKAEKGTFVPLSNIPESLINAVVAVEDARFWSHKGIDYLAIGRALFKDIIHGELREGGSTITQQLAKVVFLTPEKTLQRKIREAALAIKIEKNLDKREILELYLNKIYFGHGAYGVEMASRTYFAKPVGSITVPEAALIAGLIRAPSLYSPFNDLGKARERQSIVLARMVEEGYMNKSDMEHALKQPLALSSVRQGIDANNYFIEYVRKYLEDKYGIEKVYKGNLRVYTTLDRNAQAAAAKAVQEGLRALDKRRGWRGPIDHKKDFDVRREMKTAELSATVSTNPGDLSTGLVVKVTDKEALIKTRGVIGKLAPGDAQWAAKIIEPGSEKIRVLKKFALTQILKPGDVIKVSVKTVQDKTIHLSLQQEPQAEAALVALDQETGFIRAMIGGYDFVKSDYNRVIYAQRQPGSAFKPIIYAAALEHGYTPASIITDEPVTYTGGPRGDWSPENADHKFHGPTTLRKALTYSRNVVTVKLVDTVGIDNVVNFARTIGVRGELPRNLTLALGSLSTSPLELALCYSVFANGGMKIEPVAIKFITDTNGTVIESNEPEAEQVISSTTAFLITSMLESVVQRGTGWRAKALGRPVAGKTGTTNEYRDAWFVGYTTNLTAAVWVGFDDTKPLGALETGARTASPIWVSFMQNALSGPGEEFSVPEGITVQTIDPQTGLLVRDESDGVREYFKEGTEPRTYSLSPLFHRIGEQEQEESDDQDANLNFD